MLRTHSSRLAVAALPFVVAISLPPTSDARQEAPGPAPRPAPSAVRIGVDAFGGAGITWPAASDSFEAAGLGKRATEFGGGARVTGLWRHLFVQTTAYRWSDTGERVFVDSTGTRFPLGIPLDVKATFVDASVGWKVPSVNAAGRVNVWSYVAAGMGVTTYSENSPFGEPDDDLDTTSPSYHLLAGFEVPLVNRLAVAFDARYRFVPNVLGEGGVSGANEEDFLGGFQTSIGLRFGFGDGAAPRRTRPAPPVPADRTDLPPAMPARKIDLEAGVITEAAPVFLYPDAQRTPLKTLTAGTPVRILEETPEWVRIEFTDHFGARIGFVQRKFVRRP
jgi:hypothetical protein